MVGGDGEFDAEGGAVAGDGGNFDAAAEDAGFTGLDEATEAGAVRVAELGGDDELAHVAAEGLFGVETEGAGGLGVPGGDATGGVHADDGVERGVDDAADAGLVADEALLGLVAVVDVDDCAIDEGRAQVVEHDVAFLVDPAELAGAVANAVLEFEDAQAIEGGLPSGFAAFAVVLVDHGREECW